MNLTMGRIARRYQAALHSHLKRSGRSNPEQVRGLGSQALRAGMKIVDLAKLHEHILLAKVLPSHPRRAHPGLIKRAGAFFAVVMTPVEQGYRSAREMTTHLRNLIEILSQRTVAQAAANKALINEISHRKIAESALKESERHFAVLLAKSKAMQNHLRLLSRQILTAQEEERKSISRELHDVIAQALTGINIRLAALRKEAAQNIKGLDRNIIRTQQYWSRNRLKSSTNSHGNCALLFLTIWDSSRRCVHS